MSETANTDMPPGQKPRTPHGTKFWGIFIALCLLSSISTLDVAINTTALPKITEDIGGATQALALAGYIWGVTISGVIFSAIFNSILHLISDAFFCAIYYWAAQLMPLPARPVNSSTLSHL
ncbi:hypothetical protein F4780DRAFT_776779 [Xylariomycetidae sp. FL0641]|nr:hypothetical protein F4780DRAFT_776779 [Xylariomycetidae sp. FL0641]